MFGKIKSVWLLWLGIEGVRLEYTTKRRQGDAKHRTQVALLEEQLKLRDLQIKNLVAENQRNFERIKAETATFSADVVKATTSIGS